ncbi:lipoyl synthase [Candidatus Bipolaricaulota bacterium]|nr:lipoyl synthase [Candidatus Bipolaricaulota bacterium]
MTKRPNWLRIHSPSPEQAENMAAMRSLLKTHNLTTVCQGAVCPNACECWGRKTATFMILGATCTRACRFCAVPTGNPQRSLDTREPHRLAAAVRDLELQHVVITSVDRDDLPDGGANHFADVIRAIHRLNQRTMVEVLIPDFCGRVDALRLILEAKPDVIGHNIETVRRLSPTLRDPRAGYDQSIAVLAWLHQRDPHLPLKSSLMLGLGETQDEILACLRDLHAAGACAVTLGQYMPPNPESAALERYIPPEEFNQLAEAARQIGFSHIVSEPLARSSYHADEISLERI